MVEKLEEVRREVRQVIVGQDTLVERLLVALLANGHVLLEGVPGLAKTKTLVTLAGALEMRMSRIQFTPDLLPSDLIGTEIYRPGTGEFKVRHGPVFANIILADEINRAPAKVQAALLEAMQERQVTIGETTFKLPEPFLVLATQNPIEQEGTYPLPEAQLDRFLMKLKVEYPSFDDEVQILALNQSERQGEQKIHPVMSAPELLSMRNDCLGVFVDPKVDRYIVSLVQATRKPKGHGLDGLIDWGASPRAGIALRTCAQALAFLRGRPHVTPAEVKELAPDVLRHRILLSLDAEAKGVSSDEVIKALLSSVTVP